MKYIIPSFFILVLLAACSSTENTASTPTTDIVIYGGTAAAVTAAAQAVEMGKSVVVVSPDKHLGGLSASGLGFTDTGNKGVIGGLARNFYQRIYQKYQDSTTWKWQMREDYGNRGQGTPATDGENRTMWIFEPSVAEEVFEDMAKEYNLKIVRDEWLDREDGVVIENGQIQSIRTLSGNTYKGKIFVDATYEGDLMAAAGVNYHVGREANSVYNEEWNGVQPDVRHHKHHFGEMNISPYVIPDDPDSGVLPLISTESIATTGSGDKQVQAYCFRTCLTKVEENRIPVERPEGYDSTEYELLLRVYEKGWDETFWKFDPIPNAKTDVNNHGPFSFDYIGMNYDYPEGSYERRKEVIKDHERYQKGLLYFIANDPRVPKEVQTKMQQWGLSKDEFKNNGNWPHQIYVREARRMIGDFVMTENEILGKSAVPKPIGMGSYTMDSHNTQRYITAEGYVQNEGDIGVKTPPYQIDLGTILPKQEECTNLLVPVAVSSSHIAFGSIRMEPVFMILGQSAGTVAAMALDQGIAIHELPYEQLEAKLIEDGQVLSYKATK